MKYNLFMIISNGIIKWYNQIIYSYYIYEYRRHIGSCYRTYLY